MLTLRAPRRRLEVSRYFTPSPEAQFPPQFGFRSNAQSVHGSRTIMLVDITALLNALPPTASQGEYQQAIMDGNVLGKGTASTRLWAWKKLRELYSLDLEVPLFRLLRRYWDVGTASRPQ